MLIESYELDVFTPPCEPGAERFAARALFRADLTPALPYLNATLPGAQYNPEAPALLWKKGGHTIAFHPDHIATSNVDDRQAAQEEIDGLIALVNRTWDRREEIEPSFEVRRRPTPMALFALLPQTNCAECGSPTCFTFALRLAAGQAEVDECPPLMTAAFEGQRARLRAMLIDAPARG
jgi:ArsR family metal-binding transcriptional regulator